MKPARDSTGVWGKAISAFCDELGFDRDEVWFLWGQFAGMREFESRTCRDRHVAEAMAYDDIVAVYDKRGSVAN